MSNVQSNVIILYEQQLDPVVKKNIISVLPSVCELATHHLDSTLTKLLDAYDIVLVNMKVTELQNWWIAQRTLVPKDTCVWFCKNHGNSKRNSASIKEQLCVDYVIKNIVIPADKTVSSFITANSVDYVCKSEVFEEKKWKSILKFIFSLFKK
jgi:hypothetical protein